MGMCRREQRQLLVKCAATALSSKLVAAQKEFFANMVVDAVLQLDELLPLNMIGIKKVQGGALEVSVDCRLSFSFFPLGSGFSIGPVHLPAHFVRSK